MTLKAGQRIECNGKQWLLTADAEVEPAPVPLDSWASMPPPSGELVALQAFDGSEYVARHDPTMNTFTDSAGKRLKIYLFRGWRWPSTREKLFPGAGRGKRKKPAPAGDGTHN